MTTTKQDDNPPLLTAEMACDLEDELLPNPKPWSTTYKAQVRKALAFIASGKTVCVPVSQEGVMSNANKLLNKALDFVRFCRGWTPSRHDCDEAENALTRLRAHLSRQPGPVSQEGDAQPVNVALSQQRASGSDAGALTFDAFRAANAARCVKWHPAGIASWSDSDWIVAIVGELGELASFIKMRNRERDGLPGNKFSPTDEQIAKEAADVYTYLDLFCERNGINLGRAAVEKFNEVSKRVGFPDRINVGDASGG